MHYLKAIQNGLLLLTICASTQAFAGGDPDYPGAYFEPKVLYQAPGISAPSANTATEGQSTNGSTAGKMETTQPTDSNAYPGASFEPQVIYQDPSLQEASSATASQPTSGGKAPARKPPAAFSRSRAASSGAVSDSSPPYTLVLIVAAVIGLAFWLPMRQKKSPLESKGEAARGGNGPSSPGTMIGGSFEETEEEELEAIAEGTLAKINRQRSNKSKRARRH